MVGSRFDIGADVVDDDIVSRVVGEREFEASAAVEESSDATEANGEGCGIAINVATVIGIGNLDPPNPSKEVPFFGRVASEMSPGALMPSVAFNAIAFDDDAPRELSDPFSPAGLSCRRLDVDVMRRTRVESDDTGGGAGGGAAAAAAAGAGAGSVLRLRCLRTHIVRRLAGSSSCVERFRVASNSFLFPSLFPSSKNAT